MTWQFSIAILDITSFLNDSLFFSGCELYGQMPHWQAGSKYRWVGCGLLEGFEWPQGFAWQGEKHHRKYQTDGRARFVIVQQLEYTVQCTSKNERRNPKNWWFCTKNGSFWTMIFRVLTPFSVLIHRCRSWCASVGEIQMLGDLSCSTEEEVAVGNSTTKNNRSRITVASLKLTVRTWVHGWLVQMSFVFAMSHFHGQTVSFRECNHIGEAHGFSHNEQLYGLISGGGPGDVCLSSSIPHRGQIRGWQVSRQLKDEWKSQDSWEKATHCLGGGNLNIFLCSPLFGEGFQFD